MQQFEFHHAAVAGTFDHFHDGHKALLKKAFTIAKKVSVGITDAEMTQGKIHRELIEDFNARKMFVTNFLKSQNYFDRAKIFELHNLYGPALADTTLEALVVSSKTLDGAKAVNDKRLQLGLSELAIVVADYVYSSDQSYLSSTRIRLGEINRNGLAYKQFLFENCPLTMSLEQREALQKPLGQIVTGPEDNIDIAAQHLQAILKDATGIFVVGDIVSKSFQDNHFFANLFIYDDKNKRESTSAVRVTNPLQVKNPAGSVSKAAVDILSKFFASPNNSTTQQLTYLFVDGEEDLLVLPIILLAPINSVVLYGQSGQGIVLVKITEAEKEKIWRLLSTS